MLTKLEFAVIEVRPQKAQSPISVKFFMFFKKSRLTEPKPASGLFSSFLSWVSLKSNELRPFISPSAFGILVSGLPISDKKASFLKKTFQITQILLFAYGKFSNKSSSSNLDKLQ